MEEELINSGPPSWLSTSAFILIVLQAMFSTAISIYGVVKSQRASLRGGTPTMLSTYPWVFCAFCVSQTTLALICACLIFGIGFKQKLWLVQVPKAGIYLSLSDEVRNQEASVGVLN